VGLGGPGAGGVPKRDPIYNVQGIHEKMETFAWCEEAEWVETLVVTSDDATAENVDVTMTWHARWRFYTQVRTRVAGVYCTVLQCTLQYCLISRVQRV